MSDIFTMIKDHMHANISYACHTGVEIIEIGAGHSQVRQIFSNSFRFN